MSTTDEIATAVRAALRRPLTAPGSEALALRAIEAFGKVDMIGAFAANAEQTLRDGQRHDFAVVSPEVPQVALSFVA